MSILRLSTVALTLVLFTMGALILPVNTAFAHCTGKGKHTGPGCDDPHGGGGGGDGGVPGTFTVEVFFGANAQPAGTAVNVVGDSNFDQGHFRAGLGATDMVLNLRQMETTDLIPTCDTDFGAPIGRFAISTARHEEDGPLTFSSSDFFNFTAGDPAVSYSVNFGNGVLDQLGNWLPAPQSGNTLTGVQINLAVTKGRTKKGPCNGIITQNWHIDVFNNAPVVQP